MAVLCGDGELSGGHGPGRQSGRGSSKGYGRTGRPCHILQVAFKGEVELWSFITSCCFFGFFFQSSVYATWGVGRLTVEFS